MRAAPSALLQERDNWSRFSFLRVPLCTLLSMFAVHSNCLQILRMRWTTTASPIPIEVGGGNVITLVRPNRDRRSKAAIPVSRKDKKLAFDVRHQCVHPVVAVHVRKGNSVPRAGNR